MTTPTILTVILNWRTPDLTLQAAEATLPQMAELGGEIVIVDNDSGDGSFETMSAAVAERGWDAGGRVRVLQSGHNGGFGAGNNFGMRQGLSSGAAPDYYFILNSDAWPEPGAIAALLATLEARPDAGMAGSYDLQRIEARLAGLEQSVSATLAVLNQLLQAVRRDTATEEDSR